MMFERRSQAGGCNGIQDIFVLDAIFPGAMAAQR
jgi:hypothetical protein